MSRRHTPREIVARLRAAEDLLAAGAGVREVAARLGVSEATFHRWRAQYGGIKAADAARLAELERENRDLKALVANQCLDILMLRQLTQEQLPTPQLRGAAVHLLQTGFGVSQRRACEVVGLSRTTLRRTGPDVPDDDAADRRGPAAHAPAPGDLTFDPGSDPSHGLAPARRPRDRESA